MGLGAVAVAGVAVAAGTAIDSRNARQGAADDVEDANIQSANQLAAAGAAGERDIASGARSARQDIVRGGFAAAGRIDPYRRDGEQAYDQYKDAVLKDSGPGDTFTDHFKMAADGAVDRNIYDVNPVISSEILRQGGINASGFNDTYRDMLLSRANQGVAAINDFSGIASRINSNLARVSASEGGQIASSLIGQGPQLQEFANNGMEARMLGGIADSNFRSSLINTAAGAAGDYYGSR